MLQVVPPLHQAVGANLGSRTSAWLNDRLMVACDGPAGIAHLERPDLTNDLTMARDFDLGITGPPLSIAMDFIAGGLVELVAGLASAVVLFRFSLVGAARCSSAPGARPTGCCARAGSGGTATPTRCARAQRHADYAYRLAVDAPAAKEVRLFGLADWVIDRFAARRRRLYELQWRGDPAARAVGRSAAWSSCSPPTSSCSGRIADAAADGRIDLAAAIVFLQAAVGISAIAFGGLSWALDGAAAPVAAVLRLGARPWPPAGALPDGDAAAPTGCRGGRSASATSASRYPTTADQARRCSTASTSPSRPARRWPSSARTAPARRRWPSCCAASTTRQRAPSRSTASTCASSTSTAWRSRVTAVFQDFVRYELSLRDNVAPAGAPDEDDRAPRSSAAGGADLADLDTVLAKGYAGGTDLSGGQWQRVALARALCAVRRGAGVVLLDEPTAQLDVRGEAEIFERVLAATRDCTTILDLAPLLDRAPGRPHLRARARPGRRARHPRRADGARRPLPDDVRPAGVALRRGRRARARRWSMSRSLS